MSAVRTGATGRVKVVFTLLIRAVALHVGFPVGNVGNQSLEGTPPGAFLMTWQMVLFLGERVHIKLSVLLEALLAILEVAWGGGQLKMSFCFVQNEFCSKRRSIHARASDLALKIDITKLYGRDTT